MELFKWTVTEEEKGLRLDQFVKEKTDDFSRSRIQQLIEEGYVLVNEKEMKSNYKVKVDEVITCEIPENKELDMDPIDMDLDIVYEDEDVIVVNKKKGIVVHPGAGTVEPTLVHGLLYHCKDLSGINGVTRPGIVHRIDKDTSGLLIIAKNDAAHESLASQLVDKTVNRLYKCIVHGVLPHDVATIDAPIGRDPKDRLKMTVTNVNSRNAVTHIKVLERFKEFTLVECRLETGRTHQIRVHMKYIGFPIAGDPKYSFRKPHGDQGQILHAYQITFMHPRTKEKMTFTADIDERFENMLSELRER